MALAFGDKDGTVSIDYWGAGVPGDSSGPEGRGSSREGLGASAVEALHRRAGSLNNTFKPASLSFLTLPLGWGRTQALQMPQGPQMPEDQVGGRWNLPDSLSLAASSFCTLGPRSAAEAQSGAGLLWHWCCWWGGHLVFPGACHLGQPGNSPGPGSVASGP